MNKYNIKNGMKLVLRNDDVLYIIDGFVGEFERNTDKGDILLFHCELEFFLKFYEDNLTYKKDSSRDIVEIYNMNKKILWERDNTSWKDIKLGTLVDVKDEDEDEWKIRKFIKIIPFEYSADIYVTLDEKMEDIEYWKQCKIHTE